MDTLSQRYACPFLMLDEFIRLEQLHDFFKEVMKTIAEERKEKYNWEFYLHKVYDKSYKEFIEGIEKPTVNEMSHGDIKTVVEESASILDGFIM